MTYVDGFVAAVPAAHQDAYLAHARKAGLYAQVTREADANHDGVVTREEARAYYASK